ncbi:MAG: nucleoside recognition domain-containing protein [Porphyromonadaceae bacterium]|nr:nucleoside recognition domain-containing protein [Porphyromonadaceae bacterium]
MSHSLADKLGRGMLNYIFAGFFVVALFVALGALCLTGDFGIFEAVMQASFDGAKNGFEIALYLTGMLCLWLGLLRIAEEAGLVTRLARLASPVLRILFPSIPKGHPAMGNIVMNISANMLGLDNAATPLGLKTMQQLQELNPNKTDRPSDAMLMFIGLNASGLTIIPTSIIAFRMQAGASNPADVFLPILMATTVSTLIVSLLIALRQRINLLRLPMLLLLGSIALCFAGIVYGSILLAPEIFARLSTGISATILVSLMSGFVLYAICKRIPVYEVFVEGAKEGFSTAITIVPYLVAMLVSIGIFRASGAMGMLSDGLVYLMNLIQIDAAWVEALPTILMKPLSGSGARGLMVDAMQTHGADSFVGRLASTVQGASDTTFYVIALYLGSVGIRQSSYILNYSLLGDLAGAVTAIGVTYLFFG